MERIGKIIYLNLDRRPDRNMHFLNSCFDVGIPVTKIERYQALDGADYKLTPKEMALFEKCDIFNKNNDPRHVRTYNNIACNQLGHYYMIKSVIDNNYDYAIICQDDVYFRDDFLESLNSVMNNYPKEADILNIGFHKYGNGATFVAWDLDNKTDFEDLGKARINDNICVLKDSVNPCSLAYIITNEGALNLMKHFNEEGFLRATDGTFNDYCHKKNIFYGSIPVLCTGNPRLGSDIF